MYWSIDYETNELKSKVVLTSVRPEDIPGFLITKEPPKKKTGYAIIYNHDKAVWEQIKDNRGKAGYVNGTPYTHKDLSPLPENFTDEKPPMSEKDVMAHVRMTRNNLLDKSDYFMLDDVFNNLTSKQADDLQSYRQALRDFPATIENVTDIESINYPTPPKFIA